MDDKQKSGPSQVSWEGDSRHVLCSFPIKIRRYLGADLRRVQVGEKPFDSRSMKSIGRGVFELRQRDQRGWYRLVYLAKVENTIYVLHCFEKRSRKTPQKDLDTAKVRLKAVRERLRDKKKKENKHGNTKKSGK